MQIESVKFMLFVQDMARATAFYRDVIGLEVRSESSHWTELMHGDTTIALHGGGSDEFVQTGLGIQVSNIERACFEVDDGGGTIRKAPYRTGDEPVILADLTDPEGNGFTLSQMVT